jgi:hypothetical protein
MDEIFRKIYSFYQNIPLKESVFFMREHNHFAQLITKDDLIPEIGRHRHIWQHNLLLMLSFGAYVSMKTRRQHNSQQTYFLY